MKPFETSQIGKHPREEQYLSGTKSTKIGIPEFIYEDRFEQ